MTPMPECSIAECSRPIHAKGYCQPHYKRSRTGELGKPIRPLYKRQRAEDRFWAKVDVTAMCWHWTGGKRAGYGSFSIEGRNVPAHRYAWELLIGPIPDGLEIDHMCRVRSCVNPDHLEPVTHGENMRRAPGGKIHAARCATRTHCVNGHEYTPENTGAGIRGRRFCRMCRKLARKRRNQIKKQAA